MHRRRRTCTCLYRFYRRRPCACASACVRACACACARACACACACAYACACARACPGACACASAMPARGKESEEQARARRTQRAGTRTMSGPEAAGSLQSARKDSQKLLKELNGETEEKFNANEWSSDKQVKAELTRRLAGKEVAGSSPSPTRRPSLDIYHARES